MSGGVLVVRGGAIGDFILTLPAIRLIREAFPQTRLEILGYKHIGVLAEGRFYADSVRSIEYAAMAGFFAPGTDLDPELAAYFSGFGQVISYLSDPYGYFEANLKRVGVRSFLSAYAKISDESHVAVQLARPLERLALFLDDPAARIYPSEEDRIRAVESVGRPGGIRIALHPGSGSPRKNWMWERWKQVVEGLFAGDPGLELLLVGGEADEVPLRALKGLAPGRTILAEGLCLPHLAAALEGCGLFLGHDSGISHLAAAVGTPCLLLFGATDPMVWAPANPQVTVMEAPYGDFSQIQAKTVLERAQALLKLGGV
jgi:heptosyltransferase-3